MYARWTAILMVGALVPGGTLAAQGSGRPSLRASPSQIATTAQLRATVGESTDRSHLAEVPFAGGAPHTRHDGLVLMIVGAAGMVTGLLVDEDIVTIAGAGAAGVGLYLYLR